MQAENADLTRQLEEAEHRVSQLSKDKSSLSTQFEEARRGLEDETRVSIGSEQQSCDTMNQLKSSK